MNSPLGFFSKRERTPIESREYGKVYLALSGLLFLGTMWAVVDEVMTRRPWKDYQREYHELSLRKWRGQLEQATANFDSASLVKLDVELSEAEKHLKSPEYTQAVEQIRKIDDELLDVSRDLTFAKSLEDEAYYFWKKSIHEGKEDQSWKAQVMRYGKEKEIANARVEELEARKDSLNKFIGQFQSIVREIRSKRNELFVSIENAKTKIENIKRAPIAINQVIMNNFDLSNFGIPKARVDRCQTCHAGWKDELMEGEDVPLQFRKHPLSELLSIHNPEVYGCTSCHQGQGPALTEGFAHGYDDHYWEWPLLTGKEVYASCNRCHLNELHLKYAEPLNKAKMMLVESGCFGCHEIKGFTDLPKIGPELNQLVAKTKPEWLFRWIRNPKDYNPHTRMPNFRFADEEAEAIAAYLWNVGKNTPYQPQRGISGGGAPGKGKLLVETIGCKGCHVIGDDTRMRETRGLSFDIAPELTHVGSKVDPDWLFEWIKNPRKYRADAKMPSLRLTDQEARDVVAYLMTLTDGRRFEEKKLRLDSPDIIKRGDKLIREYGCHGCHAINGMEKEGRVSVALSNFGRKRVDEFDFGDTKVPHTWDDWTFNKIKDARIFTTDRIISKMPVFAFADSEIVLLRTLLRGTTKEEPREIFQKPFDKRQQQIEAGRRLTLYYNCINCHIIEETGGFIAATLGSDGEGMEPPLLRPEGTKVQEPWLHDFLQKPTTIRPWLTIRMPTFNLTDDEITTLTKYFLSLHDQELKLRDYTTFLPDPKLVSAGKRLFDDFQCLSCHFTGVIPEGKTPADLAPNLALSRSRLKPEWIIDWIRDPGKIQPGTRMPTYFPDGETYEMEILGGDAEKQIQALRDYVIFIGK